MVGEMGGGGVGGGGVREGNEGKDSFLKVILM